MKKLLFIGVVWLCIACEGVNADVQTTISKPEKSNWKPLIDSTMDAQIESWNSGDLKGFMQAYLQTDSLVFVGKRGLTYGWNATLGNYKKSYPDQETMGTLRFDNLEYTPLGDENALVIGKWSLFRTTDTLEGSYSLNWQLVDGQWIIIADHSS